MVLGLFLPCHPVIRVDSGILSLGTPKVSGFLIPFYLPTAEGLSGSEEEWCLSESYP